MQKTWKDIDLGNVVLKKHRNSRHYTARIRAGIVSVTLPLWGSYKQAIELLEQHRPILLSKLKTSQPRPAVTEQELRELKLKALEYLPGRLQTLASLHGFTYTSIKISRSKSRWGACSTRKNINLSLFLMQLPAYLIDYVILHELCHTKEMNHGPQFWALMDSVCNGRAKLLRKELKSFNIH
jgi:predicted metal-dependent hydrolase